MVFSSTVFLWVFLPIVRYESIENELTTRKADVTVFSYGIRRFLTGLAKK